MPWQVPITVDGLEYPVTFNTEGEPTQQDYDEAVQQILSQKAQAAPEPETETPGYLSQLGSALGLGYRQMKSGVGATFNALTGDTADVAAEMAEMSKLQREQQAAQTPEDLEFMRSLEEAEKGFEQAQGPFESIGALAQYPAAVFAQPGAAFKTAVQSAPNALISGATSLAGYGLGGLVGGVAGIETGPGAILTGLAGATAGGALSNTLMEAGPSIFDVLNERTQGAASNMTADEIAAYLQQNPDIVDEGLKTGAIRGSVIGAVEALGVKGSGRLLTMPERAAARAVQKELMAQGVDVASKEAVDKALLDPALRASTKAAAETAKNQFSSAGNMARLAGASAIETGAAGAGELAAQAAAGQDISTKEAFLEMMGDAALSLPMAATTKALEGAKYMLNPALVSDLGKASAENLAATGSTAAAEAQEGFNEAIELTMLPFTQEDIRATEMPFTREDIRATDLPFTREDIRATQLPFGREDIRATEMPFTREDIRGISTPTPAAEEAGDEVEPLSEGAERVITPEEESLAAKRRADLLSSAADVAKGKKKAQVSPAVTAMVTPQPATTQENAASPIQIQESLRQEPQDRIESREAEETSAGDQLLSPAAGEVQGEVITPKVKRIKIGGTSPKAQSAALDIRSLIGEETELRGQVITAQGVKVKLLPFGESVRVSEIEVPSELRGQGLASEVLEQITSEADRLNVPLTLSAEPFGQKGLSKEGLESWYARKGFVPSGKQGIFVREPQQAPSLTPQGTPTTATEGMVTPGGVASPLRISIPEGATSSRTDNVKYQVAGLPDEVVEPFLAHGTDSADAVEALVKSGPRKDTEHYEGRLVPKDDGSPWGNTKTSASFVIISKPGQTTSSPNEIGAVVVNRTSRGDEKTASMIAGMERRLDGTGVAVLTPEELPNWLRRTVSQTTAAEMPTPDSVAVEPGATRGVQAEPVEGSIPTVREVSPETEISSRGNLGPEVAAAEKKQAADDEAAKKRQKKQDESTKNSLNSVLDPQKKNAVTGTVTKADVETAREALTNSGEIPNAYLTNVYESVEAFLADKANARLFPSAYARLQTEKNIEGLYENGQTLIFAKQIQVSNLDRNLAKMLGIKPEQAAARRVIAHENGHKAISLFTLAEKRELRGYLMRAYSDEQIAKLVETYTEYADWRTNPESRLEALEELLMRDFEKMERIPTGGVWDDIVQFLKRVWRRLTGQKGEPNLKELKDVVRLMRNAMKRPAVPLGSYTLKDGGQVKLSYAGEKAIENLPEERRQFMRDSLDTAKAMAAAGKDSEEIRAVTGWFPGKYDGKMRWEVPDNGASLISTSDGSLESVLKHEELFSSYPSLSSVKVIFEPIKDFGGLWNRDSNTISILNSMSDGDKLNVLLHEVQHAIQDFEGFARGSNPSQFSDYTNQAQKRFDRFRDILDSLGDAVILKYNLRNGSANLGDAKEQFRKEFGREPHPEAGQHAKFLTDEEIGREAELAQERLEQAAGTIRRGGPSVQYRKTAGEIEARDVQARQKLTPEQRAATAPYSSENIAPEDAIVLFGSGPQASVQFSSDTSAAFTAGSEAARSTLYSERDMDIREAIRRAYEAMPKTNSVALPIGELFAKTEELMPGVTQEEFSLVLQDLFEDNGAVLQEGEVVEPLTEQDRSYLAAVESGDMDVAQEFVDKAAGRFASMEEQNPSEFSYGDENDQFFYHVTTKDRLEQVVYDGEGLVPNKGGQFAGAAAQTNSRGKVFFTERSGVKVWMDQVEQQLEQSRDYDEDQSPEDDLAVIRIPKHLVSDKQDDDPRNSPVQVGRDFFSTKPIPAWPETVVRDDQGRIIPLSRRFDTGADIRGQINVTTPEGKRAGFVVVMPRAAKASRIKAEDASDASKTFQADIIEAGKGRIDTASYQGNTLKSTEAPDHNENAPELYRDAAISLVDSLLSQGHSITDIADSFQDPEFRVAVGLLGNKAINPNVAQQAELFIGAEIQNRLENSFNKERNPDKKRIIEKTLKNHKAYYTTATGIGQNLNAVGALQQDPRFKWMFMFNEAEKEMADKAKEKLDTITGGGTQPVTDMVNQSEEAAADEATNEMTSDAEYDQDAIDLAAGEETLTGKLKELYEELKDLIREEGVIAGLMKKAGSMAKASLSTERRNELASMTVEQLKKRSEKNKKRIGEILEALLGKESDAKTPEQKKTRAKRKKMVDTAKKRAEAGKSIDISDTESAVKIVLREMGKARPGKQVPLTKLMPWKDILAQKAKTVDEYRQRILDAMMASDAFKEVSDEDKAKIADIFAKQWDKKRTDILDRMLEREIERKRREGSLSEAAAKALQKSRNKIIELANLGGFDNDDLMKVLGEKFGIKTGFSEAEKARISELADKLQDETLNPAKRNKLAMEFAVTLAGASEIPVSEIIANWWTSSVLFGPQTIFSIGAAFVNGAYSITTIGTRRMLADLTRGDVKGAIEESILMLQGIAKYLGAFKQAGRRAWSYLWTGNVDVLGAAANDILGEINSLEELKRFKRHKLLAENLAKDPRALRRYVGMYLRFVNRLLTSLDAFNVMVTKAGTASLALRMSGMSTDNIIKAEKMLNLKAYKDQVIRDYFDNKAPTTQAEKALVDSYAEAEMYRAVDQLGGKMENADYLASESAMTMNPTGLGGFFYRSITGLDSKMKKAAEDYLEKAKKDWITEKDLESTLFLGLAYLRQFAVQNLGGVAGYKFIRFASNKFNQGISYLPMVGLLRTLEAKGDDIKGKEAFIETIHRNQVIGAVLTLAAIAVVKALEEEPDDEERGNFWNGGWQNLTPDQKKQMLAKGQKEYTMGFKFNGRWYVFNYQNWPLNQVLAAIGSMSDQIRFSPKQWEEKGPLSKSLAGIVSGLKSTLEIPALSQLGELAGNRLASKDPTEQTVDRLSRVAAGWVGGFVPRILKDLDFATQPELRKYKTLWEKTASHIPIYRRYVGEDYYDILGQPIKRNVIPGSREFMMGPTEPEYKILGALNSRNIFLTPANAEYRMVGKGRNRRRLTQEEADAYSLETGKGYRQMLLRYGQRALQMPTERARAFLSDKADEVRDRALKKVFRR